MTVTTPGGTTAVSAVDQYTYIGAPTATGISSAQGASAGGTSVIMSGTDLTGATGVTFGATSATSFSVVNSTTISAVVVHNEHICW